MVKSVVCRHKIFRPPIVVHLLNVHVIEVLSQSCHLKLCCSSWLFFVLFYLTKTGESFEQEITSWQKSWFKELRNICVVSVYISINVFIAESIKWFKRTKLSPLYMIWLLPRPLSSVSCMSFSILLCGAVELIGGRWGIGRVRSQTVWWWESLVICKSSNTLCWNDWCQSHG